ncbi:MAG: DUF4340 domain-containing protein [Nitrospinae bacterium]|nr:DUF4340 domain-containing protein [Nitrospinota bacterium]
MLVAIVFYYYFSEKIKQDNERFAQESAKIFQDFKPEFIVSLSGILEGKDFELKKEGKNWHLISPVQDKGNRNVITELLKKIAQLKSVSNFIPEDGDYNSYGLEKPKNKWSIKDKDGNIRTLIVGNTNVMGSKGYVKNEKKQDVYLISLGDRNSLLKKVNELREKRVYPHDPKEIHQIVIKDHNNATTLSKNDKDWLVNSTYKANTEVIKKIQNDLEKLEIQNFIEENLEKKQDYFDKEKTLTITLLGKNSTFTFEVGNKNKSERYVIASNKDRIVTLNSSFIESFTINEDDFKQKKLFTLTPYNVTKVTLLYDKKKVTLKEEANEWKVNDAVKGESNKITDLIKTITSLEIKDFTETAQKNNIHKVLEASIANKSGTIEKAIIYGDEKGNAYILSPYGNEFLPLTIGKLNDLIVSADSLTNKSVIQNEFAQYTSLTIIVAEKTLTFEKNDINWKQVKGENKENLNIDKLIWDLQDINSIKEIEATEGKKEIEFIFSGKKGKMIVALFQDNKLSVNNKKYEVTAQDIDKIIGYFK